MSGRQPRVQPGWDYANAEKAAFALEDLLARHGIKIAPGSAFERDIIEVMKLVQQKRAGVSVVGDDVRADYRTLIGVHDLATLILEAEGSPSFPALVPHLRLLNEGSVLQNAPSPGSDQAANKIFELFAATLAIQCGTDIEVDDPVRSSGDNPDVLATMAGERWGIACKALHGLAPEGFMQNLLKGIEQIEHSPAEVGVVLFSMKNILPHSEIWPLAPIPGTGDENTPPEIGTGAWPRPNEPLDLLLGALDDLGETLVSYLPPDYLHSVFGGKKSVPGFLLWAHSASAVLINGRPTATAVRALNFRSVGAVSDRIVRVFRCLDWAAHPRGRRAVQALRLSSE